VGGEVPSDIVYEDEDLVAFRDIAPQAPTHVLIVPRTHIRSVMELTEGQEELAGRFMVVAKKLAEREGIAESGYRLVINCGPDGGQLVSHLHVHLIGGRRLAGRLG
jgi:histidine triad (HIT) family protein